MASTVTSRAILDDTFLRVVGGLADTSAACGNAAAGEGRRVWQLPPLEGWSGDPADLAGLIKPFDRDAANAAYQAAIADPANPGTVGDLAAMKLQIDYVAVAERGLRARLASPVRCLVHAAARRIGHGNPAGVFHQGVIAAIQDVVAAAAATS